MNEWIAEKLNEWLDVYPQNEWLNIPEINRNVKTNVFKKTFNRIFSKNWDFSGFEEKGGGQGWERGRRHF